MDEEGGGGGWRGSGLGRGPPPGVGGAGEMGDVDGGGGVANCLRD